MTLPKWAEAQLDTQERSIEKLKENNRKLSDQHMLVVTQANNLTELLDKSTAQTKEVKSLLQTADDWIDVLETLNKNLEADIADRLNTIKRLEDAVCIRDTRIDDLDRANDRLSHELKERDQRINGLLAKLAVFERS
jgi:hypothetical protein